MRQKTINLRNQGSFDKKIDFFFPDPKSHTQMDSLRAKNASEKFSRLGTFNIIFFGFFPVWHALPVGAKCFAALIVYYSEVGAFYRIPIF
jgi:hypothetical protein